MFYESIENSIANLSFATLLFTMIIYWLQLGLLTSTPKHFNLGNIGMVLANLFLLILLILRWIESGHFPLSNLYESLIFLSWALTGVSFFYLNNKHANLIGSILSPCALCTNAFASFSLPPEMQHSAPLVPALQSNWLIMHVTIMIVSYAVLIAGSLLAIAFLVITRGKEVNLHLNEVVGDKGSQTLSLDFLKVPVGNEISESLVLNETQNSFFLPLSGKSKDVTFQMPLYYKPKNQILDISFGYEVGPGALSSYVGVGSSSLQPSSSNGINGYSGDMIQNYSEGFVNTPKTLNLKTTQELIKILDNLSYRLLSFGFPCLTIGILSGAVWANEAWGSYWSWDPKETWALLTWLVFAVYLHTRFTKGWQGRKPALIATIGFLVVWVCFLGVNLLGKGLHSYGWLS
uniref:Cytochrome c biogenesis protein CcsA n=1 Tax=Koshicola spirodelophila TaxID=1707787 RepID=A0A160E6X0_9CHLO|nr:heme attachment to plastid cytochrome c [Koshicola spirodelophila]